MAMDFKGNCTLNESTTVGPGVYCDATTDSATCWPATLSGHVAKQPCPFIFGAPEGRFVHKQCGIDGKWTESAKWKGFGHSDYSECIEHIAGIENVFDVNFDNTKQEVESRSNTDLNYMYLYITFLAISCVSLLSYFVFIHCVISSQVRVSSHNRILKQLVGALTCEVFITATLASLAVFDSFNETKIQSSFVCTILVVAKEYVESCVYFWCMIHSHFILKSQTRQLRTAIYTTYVLIGWGLSSVPTTIWAVTSFLIENATTCCNNYQFMASIWILTSTRIITMIFSMCLIVMSLVRNPKPSHTSTIATDVHRMRCNLLCCFWINVCMVAMTTLSVLEYAFGDISKRVVWLETLFYIFPGMKGFIVTIFIAVFNFDLRDYFSRFQYSSHRNIVSVPIDYNDVQL